MTKDDGHQRVIQAHLKLHGSGELICSNAPHEGLIYQILFMAITDINMFCLLANNTISLGCYGNLQSQLLKPLLPMNNIK